MILVTGATGHVGGAVVSRLASLGHDVIAMVRDVLQGGAPLYARARCHNRRPPKARCCTIKVAWRRTGRHESAALKRLVRSRKDEREISRNFPRLAELMDDASRVALPTSLRELAEK